jgi:excisionase family DNA binding protein
MAQLRTLPKAYEAFKAKDPETALTKNYFRTLVKTGAIPSVRLGKNYLLDVETLDEHISAALRGC